FVASRVGGDRVSVANLTPPGAAPHDLELTPGTVARIEHAGVVVYLSGRFQPAIEDAAAKATQALDVRRAAGPALEGSSAPDPHFWLDPSRMVRVAQAVDAKLESIDASHAAN